MTVGTRSSKWHSFKQKAHGIGELMRNKRLSRNNNSTIDSAITDGWEVMEFSPPPFPPPLYVSPPDIGVSSSVITSNGSLTHGNGSSLPDLPGTIPSPDSFTDSKAILIFSLSFVVMAIAQFSLHLWRKQHIRSYHMVTLIFLWVTPPICAIHLRLWEMLVVWCVFSGVTAWLMACATERPLKPSTPRVVYQWFTVVYRLCMFLGCLGYFVFMVNILFLLGGDEAQFSSIGCILLCYGLYYGIVGRDMAEVCTDCMSSRIGFGATKRDRSRTKVLPPHTCAICNQELGEYSEVLHLDSERDVTLSCGHSFHEFCLKGWIVVGKKDTCPFCAEKVDYRGVLRNPWASQSYVWSQVLDALRYLVLWNPIILITLHIALYLMKANNIYFSVLNLS